ncbi:MAG: transcription repressor NadR [Lachnospiraceae bacterium]|nr:transcription repressor NadR [Lachnospiraceae bacterium]
MNNKERREKIIQILKESQIPVSGSKLASMLSVSRQVIVTDIALLRTEYPILATAQGYLLYDMQKKNYRKAYAVRHTAEEIHDELLSMVKLGGHVLDVIVEHDVYGQIRADLDLTTPADVEHFCRRLESSSSGPLFPISAGIHLHTVEADSEEALEQIEQVLKEKGWLL